MLWTGLSLPSAKNGYNRRVFLALVFLADTFNQRYTYFNQTVNINERPFMLVFSKAEVEKDVIYLSFGHDASSSLICTPDVYVENPI